MKKYLVMLLVLMMILGGCKDDDDELPASHTINKGGSKHAAGLFQATENCTSCHGGSLKGDDGPSCYKCHGQKWD